MQILPVLDLMDGVVVRGVAGRRDEYRPVESRLASSADPLTIARAFRDRLGLSALYVADLDAILHARAAWDLYHTLADEGFDLTVDAGLRDVDGARRLIDSGAAAAVAGLETWPGPAWLGDLCRTLGDRRVVFSLDLKAGRPLGDAAAWESEDPFEIAFRAIDSGVRQMIVLDLAQVGVGRGISTTELCRRIRTRAPELRMITGGGVRDLRDIETLADDGVDAVLIASALHDGRIGRADVEALRG